MKTVVGPTIQKVSALEISTISIRILRMVLAQTSLFLDIQLQSEVCCYGLGNLLLQREKIGDTPPPISSLESMPPSSARALAVGLVGRESEPGVL
jgi:hypothetical protein